MKGNGQSLHVQAIPADCVWIWRRWKCDYRIKSGLVVVAPRGSCAFHREIWGGETNRAKNVAPDDRMQLSGLDGWGGKGVPPDETHHDQGETPGTSVSRDISSTVDPLCKNNTDRRVHWMREFVLLYIVSCKVVQAPSPRSCKARECAGITVSMHPPCGPLSKRIRDSVGIAEILGILPEAYSEALQLVCWAYHQLGSQRTVSQWLNVGALGRL
jgi:hypothetical protein